MVRGHIHKGDAHPQRAGAAIEQRHNLHIQIAHIARDCQPFGIPDRHQTALAVNLVNPVAKLWQAVKDIKLLQRAGEVILSDIEQGARPFVRHDQKTVEVYDKLRDRAAVERGFPKTDISP